MLLADEPTGNLDTRTSIDVMGLFQELNDAGITIVIVTHELDIAAYCKRIVVMRDGRLIDDRRNDHPQRADEQRAPLDREEQRAKIDWRRVTMLTYLRTLLLRVPLTAMIALRALRRNKLRSSLTALGIIIGVFAVVAMVAVGNGARARIEAQVSALGQNMLTIFAGSRRAGGVSPDWAAPAPITLAGRGRHYAAKCRM